MNAPWRVHGATTTSSDCLSKRFSYSLGSKSNVFKDIAYFGAQVVTVRVCSKPGRWRGCSTYWAQWSGEQPFGPGLCLRKSANVYF